MLLMPRRRIGSSQVSGPSIWAQTIIVPPGRPKRRSWPRSCCTHVINYSTEDFVARTKEITNGRGVDVV